MTRETSKIVRTSAGALLGLSLLIGGCATKGQVRRQIENERTQTSQRAQQERAERLRADSVQRELVNGLNREVARLQAELAAVRVEMQSLRTEFGAKITAVEGNEVYMLPVHFDFNDATIRPVDYAVLEKMATMLARLYPGAMVSVIGYADARGSAAYNLKLSRNRAEAVRSFISAKGVDSSLIRTKGYGESSQVKKGASKNDAGAELNRRVTFEIETGANYVDR